MYNIKRVVRWLTPGIHVKRWLFVMLGGIFMAAIGLAFALLKVSGETFIFSLSRVSWVTILTLLFGGITVGVGGVIRFSQNIVAPFRHLQRGTVFDAVYQYSRQPKGIKLVAIGGGTGLPAVLRGMKQYTSNITAVVTVADDGGSSGRLRRDLGVLPPGDLRNNIAALADDENLLTQLFQYRFPTGELSGHAFGNLFIAALAAVADDGKGGSNLAEALVEIERILNIRGRVLPSTLDDVHLSAQVRLKGTTRSITIRGESKIGDVEGSIEAITLSPADAMAYPESIKAILDADLIVMGPGSLYTSILPNLLVKEIAAAIRASAAYKIYVCNVATQPGETDGYSVAEHVMALEQHIGRGVFHVVLANNAYPTENAGENTNYVLPVSVNHEIIQRYDIRYTDLTDSKRPWRHDSQKLTEAILELTKEEKKGSSRTFPVFTAR